MSRRRSPTLKALAAVFVALSLPLVAACGSSDQTLSNDQISALNANIKVQNDAWDPLESGTSACAKASSSITAFESCTGKLLDRYVAPIAQGAALLKEYAATVKGACAAKLETAAAATQLQFVKTRAAGATLKAGAAQQQFDSVLDKMGHWTGNAASAYNAALNTCDPSGKEVN